MERLQIENLYYANQHVHEELRVPKPRVPAKIRFYHRWLAQVGTVIGKVLENWGCRLQQHYQAWLAAGEAAVRKQEEVSMV